MKKSILIAAAMGVTMSGWAQKQNIQSANNYYRDKEYKKALEYIDKAINDPSTKDDPKAWYIRGSIYMAMNEDLAYKAEKPYREAVASYMKAAELKPTYESSVITQNLLASAYAYYNDAVNEYNNKNYQNATDFAQKVIAIRNLEGGKRYAANKPFDTVAAQGLQIGAFAAYYGEKYDAAIPMLTAMKNDPIAKNANVYLLLADIYKKQNSDAQYLAILDEARKQYPDNQNIRNEELNYYIRTGKQDMLIKKLEEAVAADPNSAELQFNLANGYNGMANPKDASGKELAKPANYAELLGKAETAYTSALKTSPNNAEYNYNAGVLYYNQATEFNNQMNAIKGNSAAEQKKYDDLLKKRDAMFAKALPYLEKAASIMEPNLTSLGDQDKMTYRASLQASREIYARQNQLDKAAEMKKKIESMSR
ncbi:MAG: hypothetical protein EOP56_13535 [Sphingobacteriales bacterium]|nr:MAG: hypothetical protein EOP56_13535 [Sphingobacteriales bacterium]